MRLVRNPNNNLLTASVLVSQILDKLQPIIRNTGPSLSPFNAWVLVKGLETLGLRVERHCANARRVADALAAHPAIGRVLYPGRPDHPQHALAAKQMSDFGGVVTFDVKAGKPAAFAALNRLQLVDIS
ncbi:MAG: O-succinylhomoserine sulfhydrylase, partial [Desertifilum sp. SIO1I2]|nr:O-succinylhomoserine sulfhydrylase [Desertifilum sp. SIO1I2]